MIQPWFDPNQYAWIPGTAYGVIAGVMAAIVGWQVPRGKARGFIVRAWFAVWAMSVVLLLLGIAARVSGQPWGVSYALLIPGVIGTLVVGFNSVVILKRYREVEDRRLAAKDLWG